ncbi:hypothetical protein [Burkholderia ubonensis]|nr:hypothetical protein [Burkholderia ubonensis]
MGAPRRPAVDGFLQSTKKKAALKRLDGTATAVRSTGGVLWFDMRAA